MTTAQAAFSDPPVAGEPFSGGSPIVPVRREHGSSGVGYEGIVHAERVIDCPFSVAQEYAQDYLRDSACAVVSAKPLRRRVVIRFGTRSDATEPGRPHDEIALRWFAGTSLLPNFSGTLRMRIAALGTLFLLDGRYVAPGGALGALFDRLIGKRIARATADAMLAGLAETLVERERKWRSGSKR